MKNDVLKRFPHVEGSVFRDGSKGTGFERTGLPAMNASPNTSPCMTAVPAAGSPSGDACEDSISSAEEPGSSDPEPQRPSATHPAWKPAFWMICGAASFTLMGVMANLLGTRCDWRIVAQFRTIFSFMAAATLTRMAGARFVVFEPGILWVRSIAGTLSLITTFYALTHLPVADVLTLTNTYPIWIVAIGFLVWGESVDGSILVAVVSAVFGVALIQQPHLEGNRVALVSALAAAFFTSVAMMGLNRLGQVDPRAVVAHFSAVASIAMIPLHFAGHPADFSVLRDSGTLSLLLGVGVSGTIGQIFLTKAYAAGSAPRIAVIGMSQVAMALVFDTIYRGSLPPLVSLAGMTFVVAPVIWIMLTGKGQASARRPARIDSAPTTSLSVGPAMPIPARHQPGDHVFRAVPHAPNPDRVTDPPLPPRIQERI